MAARAVSAAARELAAATSWPSDTNHQFKNLDPEGSVAEPASWFADKRARNAPLHKYVDMWLLESFPPVRCVPRSYDGSDAKALRPQKPAFVAWRRAAGGHLVPDCWNHLSTDPGAPPACRFSLRRHDVDGAECGGGGNGTARSWGSLAGYRPKPEPRFGTEHPRFMNWMRAAAFPSFRKLHGVVGGALAKGARIRVHYTEFNSGQIGFPKAGFGCCIEYFQGARFVS